MKAFLQRFGSLVAGILQGFDRLVFKGRLRQRYIPNGMDKYVALNGIRREDFDIYVAGVTKKIMASSVVEHAKKLERFRYLGSTNIDKEKRLIRIERMASLKKMDMLCTLEVK